MWSSCSYDEFGFRVEEEDGPEQSSNKLLGIPFVEEPQHRLQWVAHLEFSHNAEGRSASELTWDAVEVRLPRTDRLRTMVRAGIPHSLRPQLWMRLSGNQQLAVGMGKGYTMSSKKIQIQKHLLSHIHALLYIQVYT
jgi:hypothetical protein